MNDHDFFYSGAPGSYTLDQGARRGSSGWLAPPTATPNQSIRPTLSIRTEEPELKFACPYYKHSPNRKPKQRSCVFPGFKSIARLKEHLYRHHMQLRCLRCNEVFGNDDAALDEHRIAGDRCTTRECQRDYDDGLDQDQRSRLKKRERRSDTNTDEDKWRAIYKTLFPDEVAIPTPYCTDSELDDYHRYCRENSDRILGDKLGAIPGGVWSGSAQQMKDLVRDVQEQLFGEFHTQQNDDDHSSCTSRASTPMSASPRTPLYFEENLSMPIADSEANISKKRRMDDAELRQRQFDETMGGEACLSNNHVLYQGSPAPQIRVSPAEPQACEAFMARLNLDGNLSLPAQSVHDAAHVPALAPVPIPPISTFTFDSGMSDALISDLPDPWEPDWTLFES